MSLDRIDTVQSVLILYRLFQYCPDGVNTVRTVLILSGWFQYCPDSFISQEVLICITYCREKLVRSSILKTLGNKVCMCGIPKLCLELCNCLLACPAKLTYITPYRNWSEDSCITNHYNYHNQEYNSGEGAPPFLRMMRRTTLRRPLITSTLITTRITRRRKSCSMVSQLSRWRTKSVFDVMSL